MRFAGWRPFAGFWLFVLAACGGGGGGTAGSGDPATAEPTPDAATLDLSRDLPSVQMTHVLQVGTQATAMGAQLLGLAQFGMDAAQRLATPGGPISVTASCASTGSVLLTLDDRDGNGYASPGDVVNAVMTNCGLPVVMRTVSGSLQIEVQAATAPAGTSTTQVRITTGAAGLALVPRSYASVLFDLPPATLAGSMTARWTDSETAQQLQVGSTAADDVRLVTTATGASHTDTVRKIAITRTAHHDTATVGTDLGFLYEMGELGGRVVVGTVTSLGGRSNATPTTGNVSIGLAAGQSLRVLPLLNLGSPQLQVALLATANGATVQAAATQWRPDHAALTWDGHTQVVAGYPALDGFTGDYVTVALDTTPSPTAELDRLCNPNPGAGVSNFRADALFRHPVLSAPRSTSAALAVRWQSGAALADAQPAFQFRFVVDPSTTLGTIEDPPTVAATAVRYGALYVIRPAESLRHDTAYWLQASPDGVDWTSSITRQLANGNTSLIGSTVASFRTPATLVAGIAGGDRAVPSATQPATLQATVALAAGRAVASYQWTQVSGPPVVLATPQAASTTVAYPDAAARVAEPVVVQLAVTDTLGDTERIRTLLVVGDHLDGSGVLIYMDRRPTPSFVRRSAAIAAGGVQLGSEPGSLLLRLLPPVIGTDTSTVTLVPSDRQPLRVGRYDPAVPSHRPGIENGIEGLLLRDECQSGISGYFEVQDAAYASDGTVLRLAADLQQNCQGYTGPISYTVSFRYNSSLPLRP